LIDQLSKVPIVSSGCNSLDDAEIPFVILNDGTKLYGQLPNQSEREMYFQCKGIILPSIHENAIRVAIDVICRYLFPHAMPQLTMPYSRKARQCFHPQHIDTIEDLSGLSCNQKNELKELFSPTAVDGFIDVGAYMGYGTIRLNKELRGGGE